MELPSDRGKEERWVGPAYPVVHRVEIDEGEKTLKEAGEAAEAAGVPYALELVAGDAVDAILEVAKAKDADLIVVGSRGHGAIVGALLGSVSQGVLKRSQQPVLVDRGARASVEAA